MNTLNGHGGVDLATHGLRSEDEYWAGCRLTTIATVPPEHNLTLPCGTVLRLRTGHFFDLARFEIAFIDATGTFPPLPDDRKKARGRLRWMLRVWLAGREVQTLADEASDRGTLLDDIRQAIVDSPRSDDSVDLDRGALVARDSGGALLRVRPLLDRVRHRCPVRFSPADFYSALAELGLTNLGPSHVPGRGTLRVWLVPQDLLV